MEDNIAVPILHEFEPFKHPRLGPCLLLCEAILADAFLVRDAYKKAARTAPMRNWALSRQYDLDRAWARSNDSGYVFSFVSVCEHLGLNASGVRRAYLSGRRVTFPAQRGASRAEIVAPRQRRGARRKFPVSAAA